MTQTISIKDQFFNSLKRGTGEVFLILKSHPEMDFSDLILNGALINYAYDEQCEGSRAFYINNLIQKSKQKEKIITAVLEKLLQLNEDSVNLDQMFDLAVYFYKGGRKEAAEAIRKGYDTSLEKTNEIGACLS